MKKGEIQVLIVDDDKAIGNTLSEVIVRAGYNATVCTRTDDALNQARLKNFHAAVIDCMLPAMNGLNFTDALRQSRFGDGVVILISGIFRDKSFETDALKRTKAIGFLQKPFGPADLMTLLKPRLDALVVDKQQWTLQTILTKKVESSRDRLKVVEHLEEIKGIEFAFVLSILADAKVSGSLNIVSEDGNIFGIKLQQGKVSSVDSDTADEVAIRYLSDTGYLTQADWTEFENTDVKKNSPLLRLVQAGNISPHAAREAHKDQVVHDLKRILQFSKVNINFSPEADSGADANAIELTELFAELNSTFDALLTVDYLQHFFEEKIMISSIQKMVSFNQNHPVWSLPIVKRIENIVDAVSNGATLKEMLAAKAEDSNVLKAAYCLVMFRQILFTDAQTIKNFEQETAKRKKVITDITGKTPHQIFHYFGTSPDAKNNEVQKLFIEFVKANHPDRLPADAPVELRDSTTKLFSMVSEAYETLTDPAKLLEYQNKIKAKEAASIGARAKQAIDLPKDLGAFEDECPQGNTGRIG
jgi:DNA-binding response OmpR family regulator